MLLMITMVRIYNYDQLHLATIFFFLLHQIVLVSNGALALTKGVPEPNCAVMEDKDNLMDAEEKATERTSLVWPTKQWETPAWRTQRWNSTSQEPKRANQPLELGREDHILDEGGMVGQPVARDTVGLLLHGEVPEGD